MRRVIPCLSFSSLSVALALTGCAASDDTGDATSDAEEAVTVSGRWQLPSAVHTVAQAQFVAYDDAPPWNGPSGCSGTFFSGTAKLKSYLLSAFPGISAIGGYDCRPNTANTSQTSIHGTGRALDVMIPTIGGDANNTVGDAIGNYLITHATEFGIQLVIWDRSVWQANLSGEKLRAYTGPIPHVDHLHVELNKAWGVREDTAFFRNGIIRITAGDVNGDGRGDVLARKADGTCGTTPTARTRARRSAAVCWSAPAGTCSIACSRQTSAAMALRIWWPLGPTARCGITPTVSMPIRPRHSRRAA